MAKTEERSSERYDEVLGTVGNRLREARVRAGLTQKQLGDRAGAKQSYIFELERGRTNITVNTLVKMADVLGMDARDLLPQTGPAPLSLVVLERLLEVCERIAALLSARQRQDAELLEAFRAFADLRVDFESALKSEHSPAEGVAFPPKNDGSDEENNASH
jgi:transcriptional regulator with XRE-family HTH domain